MGVIAPLNGWTDLRAWCEAATTKPEVLRLNVAIVVGRKDEYLPSISREKGDEPWKDSTGQDAGVTGIELSEHIIGMISDCCRLWNPEPRVRVRTWAFGKQNSRPLPCGGDVFVIDDDGVGPQHGDNDDDRFTTAQLARRLGVSSNSEVGTTHLTQFAFMALLEQTSQTCAFAERMVNRMGARMEGMEANLANMQGKLLDAQLGMHAAQHEADAERLTRDIQAKDNAMKRDLINMFGSNLGRAIDVGMAALAGMPPNDPAMRAMFIKGFLKKNPGAIEQIGAEVLEEEPQRLMPVLVAWAKKNPDRAEDLGKQLFLALTESGEGANGQPETQANAG